MEIRIGDLKKSLKKIPVSFTALRNSCKLLFPGDFRINLINEQGAKTLVTNNSQFKRVIFLHRSLIAEIDPITEEISQLEEEKLELPQNSNRRIPLRKTEKTSVEIEKEEIPDNERCPVCYNRYEFALEAKCKHVLCRSCWEQSLENSLECPLCRSRVRMVHLRPFNL